MEVLWFFRLCYVIMGLTLKSRPVANMAQSIHEMVALLGFIRKTRNSSRKQRLFSEAIYWPIACWW